MLGALQAARASFLRRTSADGAACGAVQAGGAAASKEPAPPPASVRALPSMTKGTGGGEQRIPSFQTGMRPW
jgi:hypothetical protein